MSDDDLKLKAQLTDTLNSICALERMLFCMDAAMVRDALATAEQAIRPMLYVLRTPEENQTQRRVDSYT